MAIHLFLKTVFFWYESSFDSADFNERFCDSYIQCIVPERILIVFVCVKSIKHWYFIADL